MMKSIIVHIQIGSEKPYKEVEGYVKNDNSELILLNHYLGLAKRIAQYIFKNDEIESEKFKRTLTEDIGIKKNDKHPISKLANELGAKVYGGFEDEKDFCLLLPAIDEWKVGDICADKYCDETEHYMEHYMLSYGEFKFCEDFHNEPSSSSYGFYWKVANNFCELFNFRAELLKECLVSNNFFEEYAYTGVIENEVYKEFFK